MKFAVHGCQHFHIKSFIDEMLGLGHEFAGIYDTSEYDLPQSCAAKYRVPLFHNENEMLELGVELIGTAARNDQKIDVIEWAERHGIHVMADKPVVIHADGLLRLKQVMERDKIKIGMMLTARFSPAQYTLKGLIETGELGEIIDFSFLKPHKLVRLERPEWFFHKRYNGGLILDLMIHDADMLHWFTDKEVIACSGFLVNREGAGNPDFYDNAQMNVLLEGNITASLKSDWFMPEAVSSWGDGRIFATGSKGRVEIRTAGDVLSPDGPFLLFASHERKPERLKADRPPVGLCEDFINRIRNLPHAVTSRDILRCSETVLKMDDACTMITGTEARI
jgi:predicted dehydrogenase